MQTFLPYSEFIVSAECLDFRRLGKQRVEAAQIINVLETLEKDPTAKIGWRNHPAVRMWIGYTDALKFYHDRILDEWIIRGYKNNMPYLNNKDMEYIKFPKWLGNNEFHASHRSNLLRKDPIFYGKYGWTEPDNLPYIWPKD